jgi:hypothetical protein
VLPHCSDQRTTLWCLPPAAPPTSLPWLKRGVAAVTALTHARRLLLHNTVHYFSQKW